MNIITYPDERLKRSATDVPLDDIGSDGLNRLINSMIDCMEDHNGVGLTACQIGSDKKIFICKFNKDGTIIAINPSVLAKSGHYRNRSEGCLSVPSIRKDIKRHKMIKIKYIDRNGDEQILRKEKFEAAILQHELDHLNGKLIVDY